MSILLCIPVKDKRSQIAPTVTTTETIRVETATDPEETIAKHPDTVALMDIITSSGGRPIFIVIKVSVPHHPHANVYKFKNVTKLHSCTPYRVASVGQRSVVTSQSYRAVAQLPTVSWY